MYTGGNLGNSSKTKVEKLLEAADVRINGDRPWDIQVHDERLYKRVLRQGNLGLGEAYMDGWWDAEQVDQLIYHLLVAKLDRKVKGLTKFWIALNAVLFNLQRKSKAHHIGRKHYDTGNELFSLMLDRGMNYSCAYWHNARTLDQAQKAKLELTCRKLKLEPGMKVLDIGCGWGGFARYAAENHQVEVVGITVSREQVKLARESCRGLPIEIRLQDYRELNEPFDRIVSIGMIEHVGYKNYRTFMRVAHRCLRENGLFLLHTIGNNQSSVIGDPWMDKYIFPDGMLPSPRHITRAINGLFVLEDWHNFGTHYGRTLKAWHANFSRNRERIQRNPKYDERFRRMWTYFLLSCAGSFNARNNQLWQIVLSKGYPEGYERVR